MKYSIHHSSTDHAVTALSCVQRERPPNTTSNFYALLKLLLQSILHVVGAPLAALLVLLGGLLGFPRLARRFEVVVAVERLSKLVGATMIESSREKE